MSMLAGIVLLGLAALALLATLVGVGAAMLSSQLSRRMGEDGDG